jgi:hypothetical protein
MVNWQVKVAEILLPLLALLLQTLKSDPVIRMDETTVQVMGEEGRKDTQKSNIWLARGGPPDKPVVIFKYHPTRASEHVNEFIPFSGRIPRSSAAGCFISANNCLLPPAHFKYGLIRRLFFFPEYLSKILGFVRI